MYPQTTYTKDPELLGSVIHQTVYLTLTPVTQLGNAGTKRWKEEKVLLRILQFELKIPR